MLFRVLFHAGIKRITTAILLTFSVRIPSRLPPIRRVAVAVVVVDKAEVGVGEVVTPLWVALIPVNIIIREIYKLRHYSSQNDSLVVYGSIKKSVWKNRSEFLFN